MLRQYTTDHRFLLDVLRHTAGMKEPVAIDLDEYQDPILRRAVRGPLLPVDGVLVRDWDPGNRRTGAGVRFGIRLYQLAGIRFARVRAGYHHDLDHGSLDFFAVDRQDYTPLYRLALACRREAEPPSLLPVLPEVQLNRLWQNTIGFLEEATLDRIRVYGGRTHRGVLLTGDPGNGKTMACRWIWEECRRRDWEWHLVTPDAYRQAQESCSRVEAVKDLFTVERRGIIFFDDMDIALRDRDTVKEGDDQAVFLTALDGISVTEGVVFVFTTNCRLDLIDRAFKRPGRLDLVLHIEPPTAELRGQLFNRWHPEIRSAIDLDEAVATTGGLSFADIEEVKNLLILLHLDSQRWDWAEAMAQFKENRQELTVRPRSVGFAAVEPGRNGGRELR